MHIVCVCVCVYLSILDSELHTCKFKKSVEIILVRDVKEKRLGLSEYKETLQ